MGNEERKIINDELCEGSKTGYRWRANSGMGWQGKKINPPPHILKMLSSWMQANNIKHKQLMIIADPRPFRGMPEGFFDIIGWDDFTVCQYMKMRNKRFPCQSDKCINDVNLDACFDCDLNIPVAVFVGVECKTPKDNLKPKQKKYCDILKKSGGIYHVRRKDGYREK